jgi:hypothetical protein
MKCADRADQYLSYYSVLRETVKWSKNVVLYLLNCTLCNAFFCVQTLNTNKKVKKNNFLHEVGRSWIQKCRIEVSQVLITFNCQRIKHHQRGLNMTCQTDSPGISE